MADAHVWVRWCRVDSHHPDRAALCLDTVERDRVLEASTPGERAHRATSFALVRHVLSTASGMAPADIGIDRTCAACGVAHGRPRPTNLPHDVSVSHAAGWVVVAVGSSCRVGVDAEEGDTRAWTAVEAVLKCDGPGLRAHHAGVEVDTDPLRLVLYAARPALVERIRLFALRGAPAGITATVAVHPECGCAPIDGCVREDWSTYDACAGPVPAATHG